MLGDKRRRYLYLVAAAVLVAAVIGCIGRQTTNTELYRSDSLMECGKLAAADSILNIIEPGIEQCDRASRMRYVLMRTKLMNKSGTPFKSDSLFLPVVAYYDLFGIPNDRLLAHYLLGCIYRDIGESPHAVECYQDAIACADTTATDCDFNTISCVYSQMAGIFHKQLLPSQEIESRRKSAHYCFMAKDTLYAIHETNKIGDAYLLLNMRDSAEFYMNLAQMLYRNNGYSKEAIRASSALIYLYLLPPMNLDSAKILIDRYDKEYGLGQQRNILPPKMRQYYSYKGMYYEAVNNLDSAEYYYRLTLREDMNYVDKDPMYRGLLNVYTKRHEVDSIAKYARFFCEANDSSIAIKDRDLTAHIASQYNYRRIQRNAYEQERKAAKTTKWLIIFISIAVLSIFIILTFYVYYRKRRQQKQAELNRMRQELEENKVLYEKSIHELEMLEQAHRQIISVIQEELRMSHGISEQYRTQYELAQRRIADANRMHEANVKIHKEEIERLGAKIVELQKVTAIAEHYKRAHVLKSTDIARMIISKAEKSQYSITESDLDELIEEVAKFYPSLMVSLNEATSIHKNGIRVCSLVMIGLRTSAIAYILDISEAAVSNLKTDINIALFNDKSARSLRKNLERLTFINTQK